MAERKTIEMNIGDELIVECAIVRGTAGGIPGVQAFLIENTTNGPVIRL